MHANNMRCLISNGLQCKPFDREGVFDIGHSYLSQSSVIYLLCMTYKSIDTYTCTDVYNLICMNSYKCIYNRLYAFCINLPQVRKRLKTVVVF